MSEMPTHETARAFSKEKDTENRKELSEKLREERRDYFEQKRSAQEKIHSLREIIAEKSATLEDVNSKLEALSSEIEARTANKISEIANIFKLRALREKLGTTQQTKEQIQTELDRNQKLLDEYDALTQDHSALENARSELNEYYKNAGEAWLTYEKERTGRDVTTLAREHQAFFFHAINATGTAEVNKVNGVINPDVPISDRLKLILAEQPVLSVSTVKEGAPMDYRLSLWGDSGLLLAGGRVEAASTNDMASVAEGAARREVPEHARKLEKVSEAIEQRGQIYNELTVGDPRPAGYYQWVQAGVEFPIPLSEDKAEEFKSAEALGLPLYIVQDGKLYPAVRTETEQGKPALLPSPDTVSPEALLSLAPPPLGKKERSNLSEEVLTDATFNMQKFDAQVPEYAYVRGARAGKQVLERLTHPISADYEEASNDDYKAYIDKARETGVYRGAVSGREVALADMTDDDYRQMALEFYEANRKYIGTNWISTGSNSSLYIPGDLERRVTNIAELPIFAQEALEKMVEATQDPTALEIRQATGMLYGLADELERQESPDYATITQLREVAGKYLSREQFEDIKKRRLDTKGRFKIAPEEIA